MCISKKVISSLQTKEKTVFDSKKSNRELILNSKIFNWYHTIESFLILCF
jgi:hypothetical protein